MAQGDVLGIEGGGTKTTWMRLGPGEVVQARGEAGPGNTLLLDEAALAGLLEKIAGDTGSAVAAIGAAFAGCARAEERDRVARAVRRAFPRAATVEVMEDTRSLLAAAFGDGPGLAVIAGTGANVVGQRSLAGLRRLASLDSVSARRGEGKASRKVHGALRGGFAMLRIHDDMLDAIVAMRPMLVAIERRDADLARQLRRAASSVVLNLAEGSGSSGRVRTARYRTALGSARETLSCLRTAAAFGYVGSVPADVVVGRMNRVIGTLVRVAV